MALLKENLVNSWCIVTAFCCSSSSSLETSHHTCTVQLDSLPGSSGLLAHYVYLALIFLLQERNDIQPTCYQSSHWSNLDFHPGRWIFLSLVEPLNNILWCYLQSEAWIRASLPMDIKQALTIYPKQVRQGDEWESGVSHDSTAPIHTHIWFRKIFFFGNHLA